MIQKLANFDSMDLNLCVFLDSECVMFHLATVHVQ